jgi:hypothetical protein
MNLETYQHKRREEVYFPIFTFFGNFSFLWEESRFPEGKIQKIVSNEDEATIGAIKSAFPEVAHFFCVFRIKKGKWKLSI